METKDYERELRVALAGLKNDLTRCQNTIGIIESMLYLIREESKKNTTEKNEVVKPE